MADDVQPHEAVRVSPRSALIAGGNSGIGLQVARSLVALGDDVTILGRSREKGERALDELSVGPGRARFVQADLSTHDGVRTAAAELLATHDRFDVVVHTTGMLILRDVRTTDGLHPVFAVSYLSRYHLTQLLLPALRQSESPKVIMMTAKVDPSTPIDYADFPEYSPFSFAKMRLPIQVANHHYAAHLATSEDRISAAVINAGSANTDIMREAPWAMRVVTKLLGPLVLNSVEESASNVISAVTDADWSGAVYLPKPGTFGAQLPIALDPAIVDETVKRSAALVGV